MWPLIIAIGVGIVCEGIRQAGQESHQRRMKEIDATNGRKRLPSASKLELAYDELLNDEED